MRADRRRPRQAEGGPARLGHARQGHEVQGQPAVRPNIAAMTGRPAAASMARRSRPQPFPFRDVLNSQVWKNMAFFMNHEMQTTMFQPVGGMGMIGKAFARTGAAADHLQCQGDQDPPGQGRRHRHLCRHRVTARSPRPRPIICVCAIPLGVLNQIENNMAPAKKCGDRRGALQQLGQDRPADGAPLLGRPTITSMAATASPARTSR